MYSIIVPATRLRLVCLPHPKKMYLDVLLTMRRKVPLSPTRSGGIAVAVVVDVADASSAAGYPPA